MTTSKLQSAAFLTDAPAAAADRSGPDFFCVGLQKGGTTWLYDQLQHHPDVWMPPYKEIHFFDRAFPDHRISGAAEKYFADPETWSARCVERGDAVVGPEGDAFFAKVRDFKRGAGGFEAYADLFAGKGGRLSGDITPGYSALDEESIAEIAARFPDAKACLLLREPVARLWSHWRMSLPKRRDPERVVQNFRRFKAFVERPETMARSYPSEIAKRWSASFGDRFRTFFLEDIIARPEESRAEILAFLGVDPSRQSVLKPDFNRKAKAYVPGRTPRMERLMQDCFEIERRICAETFGGPAKNWPSAPY